MSDEIICTACGRPNLPEAKLCWYCQTTLQVEDEEASLNSETEVGTNAPSSNETMESDSETVKVGDDIPDWLKRIRDLKKADQPEEEEEDKWRQQILFESQKDEKDRKRKEKATPKPSSKTSFDETRTKQHIENQPSSSDENAPSQNPIIEIDMKGDEMDSPQDGEGDLPEGFKPLDTKKG
ncbi:MAG TPA: zinc ribbon domain-containing protein [Bacteroidales bacterium]|nr:zinc ribbon domain-containing protein [Bacteroidales bacterium]